MPLLLVFASIQLSKLTSQQKCLGKHTHKIIGTYAKKHRFVGGIFWRWDLPAESTVPLGFITLRAKIFMFGRINGGL